jgi:ISXO2 transposase-like protein
LFASRKLPLRAYLMAVAIFCNEVKGKSMLAMARDLGVAYQTSFVLAHKMREAMASEMKGAHVGGEGRKAEIDGGYFGGYVKPANRVENRRDRRLRVNQSGKRQCVVVIRERDGKTLPGVFASEVAALNFIRTRIARGTEVYADEGSAWNELHGRFTMHRINHQEAYSLGDGIHSNSAESFFSRMRRAEIGHHHHIAGPYLIRFAQEASWREDHRRDPNGSQVALGYRPPVEFETSLPQLRLAQPLPTRSGPCHDRRSSQKPPPPDPHPPRGSTGTSRAALRLWREELNVSE